MYIGISIPSSYMHIFVHYSVTKPINIKMVICNKIWTRRRKQKKE